MTALSFVILAILLFFAAWAIRRIAREIRDLRNFIDERANLIVRTLLKPQQDAQEKRRQLREYSPRLNEDGLWIWLLGVHGPRLYSRDRQRWHDQQGRLWRNPSAQYLDGNEWVWHDQNGEELYSEDGGRHWHYLGGQPWRSPEPGALVTNERTA